MGGVGYLMKFQTKSIIDKFVVPTEEIDRTDLTSRSVQKTFIQSFSYITTKMT